MAARRTYSYMLASTIWAPMHSRVLSLNLHPTPLLPDYACRCARTCTHTRTQHSAATPVHSWGTLPTAHAPLLPDCERNTPPFQSFQTGCHTLRSMPEMSVKVCDRVVIRRLRKKHTPFQSCQTGCHTLRSMPEMSVVIGWWSEACTTSFSNFERLPYIAQYHCC